MRYIGYVRVSTDQQADSGLSLEAQESRIRAMALVRGDELVEVVVDAAESAKDLNRPGVQKILGMVKARKVDGVIVAKLDRLTRSIRDLAEIMEMFNQKRADLLSVSEMIDTRSANGKMFVAMLGMIAEWERNIIGERTSAALQQKRKRGERAGTVPYGFRAGEDGKLTADASEGAVVARIGVLRGEGKSFRAIAGVLNEEGMRVRNGERWRFQYVARVVKGGAR